VRARLQEAFQPHGDDHGVVLVTRYRQRKHHNSGIPIARGVVRGDGTAGEVDDFRTFLGARQFKYEPAQVEAARTAMELRLRSQIARVKWGAEAESKVLAEGDTQIQKALTLFDEAAKLAQAGELGRREKEEKGQDKPPVELKASSPSS